MSRNPVPFFAALLIASLAARCSADGEPMAADFRYSPPEWQTAICLPDDPEKSLVDKSGDLLYNYGQGGREFGTRIGVEVAPDAVWRKQELYSPRVPIVKTSLSATGLEIVEEAFGVTESRPILRRVDDGGVMRDWARPGDRLDPSLKDIAVHFGGAVHYEAAGRRCRIALALCEGYWNEAGKRVQILRVEGCEPKKVDTIADLGQNKLGVFWFDGKDVNGDGRIDITVEPAPEAGDQNAILNGLWIFSANTPADSGSLLSGKLGAKAVGALGAQSRPDVILVHVTNTGGETRVLQPNLIVDTALGCQVEAQRVVVNGRDPVTCSLGIAGAADGKRVPLGPLTVPAGKTVDICIVYGGGTLTLRQALAARRAAVRYWENGAGLPYGRIEVPDTGVQALLDSSIRNIWQAREIKNGLPAFQVGPTCYRSLFIIDGAFLLEAATLLGAGDQARNGVAYELTHQKDDGRIEVMQDRYGYWKENGIVLWTCVDHARLTQDRAWLESVWPKLQRIVHFIKVLRTDDPLPGSDRVIPRAKHTDLDRGLMPHGIIDGGIQNGVEYSNTYWNLVGLRAYIEAAHWLGKEDEATQWQHEYDDMMAVLRKSAARDMRKDSHGNAYLPILMGAPGAVELPQRAQWAFCHAVYPGGIFAPDDPLVAGNMAMLEATEREGMVYGTGWDAAGIWNYFASFYGHAWLWMGNGQKAARVLYAFANHAAPVLVWREEQSLRGEPYRKVGDMPHNWASAEFIRLVRHLLVLERGDELHLLEGMPQEWARPGAVTRLRDMPTEFGPMSLEVRVAADGNSAQVRVVAPKQTRPKRIVLHLAGWAWTGPTAIMELPTQGTVSRTVPLRRAL